MTDRRCQLCLCRVPVKYNFSSKHRRHFVWRRVVSCLVELRRVWSWLIVFSRFVSLPVAYRSRLFVASTSTLFVSPFAIASVFCLPLRSTRVFVYRVYVRSRPWFLCNFTFRLITNLSHLQSVSVFLPSRLYFVACVLYSSLHTVRVSLV